MNGSNGQWIFVTNPDGPVTPDTFLWRDAEIPQPGAGEVLVRNRLLSLDPANRAWMKGRTYREQVMPGDVMHGFTISEVVQSTVAGFQPGDIVETMGGWQDYAAVSAATLTKRDGSVPLEHLAGVYSITGLTAYFGLFDVGQMRAGDTVLISAAAGAVGSIAGQIARIAGAHAVGVAGGPDKCRWLVDELGFHAAIDYKQGELVEQVRSACPQGVDLYFDNVAGHVLDAALRTLNQCGRIVCCGAIAAYDAAGGAFVSPLLPGALISRRLSMNGFIVLDHFDRRAAAERRLRRWVDSGELKPVVDIGYGLRSAPEGLIRLLAGGNRGKVAIVLDSAAAG